MRYISVLLLIVVTIVSCAGERLVIATAEDGLLLAHQLKDLGYDILGHYEELVVASTTQLPTKLVQQNSNNKQVQVVDIGDRDSDRRYIVLEKEGLLDDLTNGKIPIFNSTTIHYKSPNRVLISIKHFSHHNTHHQQSNKHHSSDHHNRHSDHHNRHSDHHNRHNYAFPVGLTRLVVPTTPIELGTREDLVDTVNEIYKSAMKKYIIEDGAPTDVIKDMVAAVNPANIKAFATYLSGEDPASPIQTRNSYSQGAKDAAAWIQEKYTGFGFTATFQPFRSDMSPNVVGIKLGKTDPKKAIVFGAHYDDRASSSTSPTQRAPGANDDGSGTAAGLEVARVFHEFNATFDYTVIFCAFAGEEQGLYGSDYYVKQLPNADYEVVGMVNADMIAYRAPGADAELNFPTRYSTVALQDIVISAVSRYVPSLKTGTSNACCSDHQPFFSAGYPAVGIMEKGGYTIDPQYHNVNDLVNRVGYDLEEQYPWIVQTILATMSMLAGVSSE